MVVLEIDSPRLCPSQLLDFRSVFIFNEDNSGAALVL